MSKAIGNALSRQILDIASEGTRGESYCCYGRVLRDASLVSHASLEFGLLKILDMKAAKYARSMALLRTSLSNQHCSPPFEGKMGEAPSPDR